jgi:putative transposase
VHVDTEHNRTRQHFGDEWVVGRFCKADGEMSRHTTFKFRLKPSIEQDQALGRHVGAARFAYNQCLQMVKTALDQREIHADTQVPWTGFDLINAFNRWKKTEDAGRTFSVEKSGATEIVVTGLWWRRDVCQQVFEEAAVDLSHGLKFWSDSRGDRGKAARAAFPKFKKRARAVASFRLRNRHKDGRPPSIRIGDNNRHRSITLPGIGQVAVNDDTRRLRRMIAKDRARILFATISCRAGHWWVSLNVEAADLHPVHHHPVRGSTDNGGWIGVDRGLSAFIVAATVDGTETARVHDAPKAVAAGMRQQRRLSKRLSRKQKGSNSRRDAAARLARHHFHIANSRRHFLHQISNQLVKTHDRLVLEDLNIAGMLANRRLARAISDAGWGDFARMLRYKQAWRGGTVVMANRWYPSSRLCPACGSTNRQMTLADRVFACGCGYTADRDRNAAVNLARWGQNLDMLTATPGP